MRLDIGGVRVEVDQKQTAQVTLPTPVNPAPWPSTRTRMLGLPIPDLPLIGFVAVSIVSFALAAVLGVALVERPLPSLVIGAAVPTICGLIIAACVSAGMVIRLLRRS